MATDRLTLARALEEGGIPRDAAEQIATQIFDAIHDYGATKADIERLETRIEAGVHRLAARIDLVEHRLLRSSRGAPTFS